MRTMLKAAMDVEAANEALRDGHLQKIMESIFEQFKPEASYFTTDNGKRTAYIFFDLVDASKIPSIAEPFFQELCAEVTFMPVMNREDLMKGLKELKFAPKKAA